MAISTADTSVLEKPWVAVGEDESKLSNGFSEVKPATSEQIKTITPQECPLTLENIRAWERSTLIREMIKKIDQGWKSTANEVATYFSMYSYYCEVGHDNQPEKRSVCSEKTEHLPWLSEVGVAPAYVVDDGIRSVNEGEDRHFPKYKIAESKLFGEIYDEDDLYGYQDALIMTINCMLYAMDENERVKFSIYLLQNWEQSYQYLRYLGSDDSTPERIVKEMLSKGLDEDSYQAISLQLMEADEVDEIKTQRGESVGEVYDGEYSDLELVNESVYDLTWVHRAKLYRKLQLYVNRETEQTDFKFYSSSDLVDVLNLSRQILRNEPLSEDQSNRLYQFMRDLLGGITGLVHTSLEDLYAAIDFKDYKLNKLTEKERIQTIISILQKNNISQDAPILDLACGTGWQVAALINAGYTNTEGVDISHKHIDQAIADYGEHYGIASWDQLGLRFDKKRKRVITCEGRSLPHTEKYSKFCAVVEEVRCSIEDNGLFIFDMPDAAKGAYRENVERFQQTLRKYGIKQGMNKIAA